MLIFQECFRRTKVPFERWERKRSKCFFVYIHLDLFRSHPSILTTGITYIMQKICTKTVLSCMQTRRCICCTFIMCIISCWKFYVSFTSNWCSFWDFPASRRTWYQGSVEVLQKHSLESRKFTFAPVTRYTFPFKQKIKRN